MMMNTTTDERRYGVINTRFHQHGQVAIYTLSISGQVWAQVEWSPAREAWCIQDASGRCLAHCDAIHGQDVDAQTAVALARRMIIDGRMPTPEEADEQLRERQEAAEEEMQATISREEILSRRGP
jgi:hypothetical protein